MSNLGGPAVHALVRPVPGAPARDVEIQAFYRDTYPQLASYCWTLVRDTCQAEDLAQEAFTRLVGRWINVREPKPYVFHVATNLAREWWRRGDLERQILRRCGADQVEEVDPDLASAAAVKAAVEALPRKLREVVLLYYYADLSVTDVAQAIRRPPGTVKRYLSEARQLLALAVEDRNA